MIVFGERDSISAKASQPAFLRCNGENKLKYTKIMKESSQLYSVWAQEVSEPECRIFILEDIGQTLKQGQ